MKTILASVYALNPQKGSEDGMGWNFVCQIARHQKLIAVTRKNNQANIEEYMEKNPSALYENMEFLYYDLPYYLRFWKRGAFGAMPYYYLWQLFLPLFIIAHKVNFDIVHNLNFHNDWTPSMLWTLGKPMIWGPVGHHPKIPKQYIVSSYGWVAYLKDRATWCMKQFFWNIDPLLKLTKQKANFIFAMNSSVQKRLKVDENKFAIMPSVASEEVVVKKKKNKKSFNVLSIGRFVPLKGFDVTIKSFAKFYYRLSREERCYTTLTLVGKGPQRKYLERLCAELYITEAVRFIDWIERDALKAIYNASDVFLFPSHEGAGMVVSEAMSYGLPVLCFNNVGPGEFVDCESGMKVSYTTYEESLLRFAHHLDRLNKDRALLAKLAKGARRRFETQFQWSVRGEQLKVVYDNINTVCDQKVDDKENLSVANVVSFNG